MKSTPGHADHRDIIRNGVNGVLVVTLVSEEPNFALDRTHAESLQNKIQDAAAAPAVSPSGNLGLHVRSRAQEAL